MKTCSVQFPGINSTPCEMGVHFGTPDYHCQAISFPLFLSFHYALPLFHPSITLSLSSLLHALLHLPSGLTFMHFKERQLSGPYRAIANNGGGQRVADGGGTG